MKFRKFSSSDDILKLSISAGILVAGLAVAYYFVVFLPKEAKLDRDAEQRKTTQESLQKAANETKYNSCLQQAFDSYKDTWNASCKSRNLPDKCQLISSVAEEYNDAYESALDRCARVYK